MIHPRTAYRWGIWTTIVSGTLAVVTLFAWGFRVDVANARPQLTLMAYMLLLLVAVAAGAVAVIASTVMSSHKAFAHGYRTAMYQAGFDVLDQDTPGAHANVVSIRPRETRSNGTED